MFRNIFSRSIIIFLNFIIYFIDKNRLVVKRIEIKEMKISHKAASDHTKLDDVYAVLRWCNQIKQTEVMPNVQKSAVLNKKNIITSQLPYTSIDNKLHFSIFSKNYENHSDILSQPGCHSCTDLGFT